MKDRDLEKNNVLRIVVADAYEMAQFDKERFIQIRRNGFGASDSSIILGVNPFSEPEDLVKQKLATTITEEELAIGEKEVVRKGADLEPIILTKFEQWSGLDTYKPDAMYQFIEHPQLTVNFDGVISLQDKFIPVEAKFVSVYANKYWDRSKRINAVYEGSPKICAGTSLQNHIEQEAQLYGVPPYYYTQLQQQLLALEAPFGYIVALFDKGWELGVYKVFADKTVQDALLTKSKQLWSTIQEKKGE